MKTSIRCKFRVSSVLRQHDGHGVVCAEQLRLDAVYGDGQSDNASWSKWTPSGKLELTISNPDAWGKLNVGQDYYIDIVAVTH